MKLTDPFGLSPNINWSTLGHALLDAVGFIPVVGAIADTINGIWYLSEGDYFSAAASFVSAIPGWGDIVGAVGKGIKGCSKITKAIKYGSKIVGRIGNIALGSYQVGSIAVSLYDKHVVQGESWDWDSTVQLFSAGLFATTTVVSAKGLKGDVGEYRKVVGNKGGGKTNVASNYGIDMDNLNFSNTVQNHTGRPYQDSKLLINEIIESKVPMPDPRGTNALSWTAEGSFNGSVGYYELIIDQNSNTVWHFVFKSR